MSVHHPRRGTASSTNTSTSSSSATSLSSSSSSSTSQSHSLTSPPVAVGHTVASSSSTPMSLVASNPSMPPFSPSIYPSSSSSSSSSHTHVPPGFSLSSASSAFHPSSLSTTANSAQLTSSSSSTSAVVATAATQPAVQHPAGTLVLIPAILNVVATFSVGVRLDLTTVALHARNAEYQPRRFSAVIMRIRRPKTTALIFNSGKIVVTGARTEEDVRFACRKYARIIQKIGYSEVKFLDFRIQNMVASIDCKFPVRLEGLAHEHDDYCSYEPELFPGLIYRMAEPKVCLLIFVSGKVICTGAKSGQQIKEALEGIFPVLLSYRKEQLTISTSAIQRYSNRK